MIAGKSADFIGQRVDIENLSVSNGRVDLDNIVVGNPKGFAPGNLLSIPHLSMKIEMADLMSGRLNFREIAVSSPQLTIIRDKEGRLNVSEKLVSFFRKKSTLKYRVDDFAVHSGRISYTGEISPLLARSTADSLSGVEKVEFRIRSLSSEPGIKSVVTGTASYLGGRISVEGWAFLKSDPKEFAVAVSSEDIALSYFKETLGRYNIDTGRSKLTMRLSAGGQTGNSVTFAAALDIKNISLPFMKGELQAISTKLDGAVHSSDNTLFIKDLTVDAGSILSVHAKAAIRDLTKSPDYEAEMKISRLDLSSFQLPDGLKIGGIAASDRLLVTGKSIKSMPVLHGGFFLRDVSVSKGEKNLVQKVSIDSRIGFDGNTIVAGIRAKAGKVSCSVDARAVDALRKTRSVQMKMVLPEVGVADVRDAFWDLFPDKLLYAGLDGFLASDAVVQYTDRDIKINSSLTLKDLDVAGENKEFSIGPVNGTLPLVFHKTANTDSKGPSIQFPVFDKPEFNSLKRSFADMKDCDGCSRITIGSAGYGFRLLEKIDIRLRQEESVLNIKHFSGNISGGKVEGTAFFDFSKGLNYRAGFILEDLSLRRFCDSIEPIRGYISGKVDGVAALKGTGSGLSNLIGKADFWTFATAGEQTKISREFLQKIGGPSLKTYLGDRKFDKGIVSLYLQDGFIIFRQLEISNKNFFGMTDLSVKVAPYNNRISIDHLMWTIAEAAQRAQKDKQ